MDSRHQELISQTLEADQSGDHAMLTTQYLVTAVFCKLIVFYNDCYFRSWGHANKPSRSDRNHGIFRIDWTELWLVTGRLLALMDGLSYDLSRKIYRACNN